MKIALLHYAAAPVVGGVESVISHHARLMADDGHEMKIIAGRGGQTDPRIPFICIPQIDSRHEDTLQVKAALDGGKIPGGFDELSQMLEEKLREALTGFDVLIAHNVGSLHKNLALTAAVSRLAESGMRTILWHHDLAWTTPRYRSELHEGYPWDLLRTAWPKAVHVTVSEPRRQELAALTGLPPEQIHVISNGLDAGRFLKLEAQTLDYIRQFNLLGVSPLLLLPVRITPRKNIELAIRALAEVRGRYPKAMLVITGPPGPHNPSNAAYFKLLTDLRESLGLKENVIFLAEHTADYIPDEVIADFYRLADALLLPSREEGFGIPVIEAGLAGMPVFCADIPPLRELGGPFATYFSPDDPPDRVGKLIVERLSGDLTFAQRQRVKNNYTWQQIYDEKIKPLLLEQL
ncbi:MAG: glycosyltransferase family 4 protein [Chloroflexi bacterium]|nr:glycosyltransferase family 4 protein [Chloroflexota bacterium]